VGISVSRVGGTAQVKAMKKIAGTMKLDQAQYRELEAFSKFGADLDAATLRVLDKGKKNVEILKQPQFQPMKLEHMIAIVYCGTQELLRKVLPENVRQFEADFIERLELQHKETLNTLNSGNIHPDAELVLKKVAEEIAEKYALSK
jgi:F-type H+-transporting ATPase subunit alpha